MCSLALHSQIRLRAIFLNARNDGNSVYAVCGVWHRVYTGDTCRLTADYDCHKYALALDPFSHEVLFWFLFSFFFLSAIETNDEWKWHGRKFNFTFSYTQTHIGYSIFGNVIYQEFDSVVKSKSKWTIVENWHAIPILCAEKIFLRCDVECKAVGRSVVRSAANVAAFCIVFFFLFGPRFSFSCLPLSSSVRLF